MAMKYVIQPLHVTKEGTKVTKYIARTSYDGVTNQEDMARLVSEISAISVGDVLSVMNTMATLVGMELRNGRIVSLGDLGRFRATVRSHQADSADTFTRSNIVGHRIIFVPGKPMRTQLSNVHYQRTTPIGVSGDSSQPAPAPVPAPDPAPAPPTPGGGGESLE